MKEREANLSKSVTENLISSKGRTTRGNEKQKLICRRVKQI